MKTITLLNARDKVFDKYNYLFECRKNSTADVEDRAIDRRSRQARRFQNYLASRIEQGDIARMALRAREWIQAPGKTSGILYCPDCKSYEYDGHAYGCPVKRALR